MAANRTLGSCVGLGFLAAFGFATPVRAQLAPDPNSAAMFFIPALAGVVATDICQANAAGECLIGTGHLAIPDPSGLYVDAVGNIYLQPAATRFTGETCTIRQVNFAISEVPVTRLSPTGELEEIGAFRAGCEQDFVSYVYAQRVATDPFNGVIYVLADVENVTTSCCNSLVRWFIVRITGLPTLRDVLLQGPSGPQGPPGPLSTPCPDADADGFRDCTTIPGCFPYGGACGDCDDTNPAIDPRGSERTPKANRRDGKDNDCNGVVDG